MKYPLNTIKISDFTDGSPVTSSHILAVVDDFSISGQKLNRKIRIKDLKDFIEQNAIVYKSLSSSFSETSSFSYLANTASYIHVSNIDGLISSSIFETASYALTAAFAQNIPTIPLTASYALQSLSSSYSLTASFAQNVSSFDTSFTGSFVLTASGTSDRLTASYALNALKSISSSYALTSDFAQNLASGAAAITYTNLTPMPQSLGGLSAGTTFNNKNILSIFDDLFYPYQFPSFTSFVISGQSTILEVGSTILSGSKTFTWGTSNSSNIQSNTIIINDISDSITLLTASANDGTQVISIPSNITKSSASSHTWQIQATNTLSSTFNRNFSVNWRFRRHWGTSPNTSLNSAQILTLSNNEFSTNRNQNRTLDGNGEYIYFSWPVSFGQPSFVVNGLSSTAWVEDIISHTNSSGHIENYYTYRSTFIQNGTEINIVIT